MMTMSATLYTACMRLIIIIGTAKAMSFFPGEPTVSFPRSLLSIFKRLSYNGAAVQVAHRHGHRSFSAQNSSTACLTPQTECCKHHVSSALRPAKAAPRTAAEPRPSAHRDRHRSRRRQSAVFRIRGMWPEKSPCGKPHVLCTRAFYPQCPLPFPKSRRRALRSSRFAFRYQHRRRKSPRRCQTDVSFCRRMPRLSERRSLLGKRQARQRRRHGEVIYLLGNKAHLRASCVEGFKQSRA